MSIAPIMDTGATDKSSAETVVSTPESNANPDTTSTNENVQAGLSFENLPPPVAAGTMKTPSCVLDICVDLSKQVLQEAASTRQYAISGCTDTSNTVTDLIYYVNASQYELAFSLCERRMTTTVNTKTMEARKLEEFMMGSSTTQIFRHDGIFIKRTDTAGCGGGSWKQETLNTKEQKVEFATLKKPYPQKITIGNIAYVATSSSISTDLYYYGTVKENVEFTGALSIQGDLGGTLSTFAREQKFLSTSYIVSFTEYPNIMFRYVMANEKAEAPERIAFLGKDSSWLTKNIREGDLYDLEVSRKILSSYADTSRVLVFTGGVDGTITPESMNEKDLPYFRTAPFDNKGNYLIYPTKKYEFTTYAELCKPAVYAYDSKNPTGAKHLTVSLVPGGFFTKLIPSFSTGTSWNFHADSLGKVSVSGNSYPYLYYSAKVPDYRFNTDGWLVSGANVGSFFENKLQKIGFNAQEKKDFIEFWIPEFHSDRSYFISFKYDEAISEYATLHFTPAPESSFRVLLEAYPVEVPDPKYIWPTVGDHFDKKLIRNFKRSGSYDVFEWGGVLADKEKTVIR